VASPLRIRLKQAATRRAPRLYEGTKYSASQRRSTRLHGKHARQYSSRVRHAHEPDMDSALHACFMRCGLGQCLCYIRGTAEDTPSVVSAASRRRPGCKSLQGTPWSRDDTPESHKGNSPASPVRRPLREMGSAIAQLRCPGATRLRSRVAGAGRETFATRPGSNVNDTA
jgi:hypothetical protein